MARTTATAVRELLADNYGTKADGTSPSLTPYIAAANAVVSRVETCATAKDITLTDGELELIERWLAAHFYTRTDVTYASKSTGGKSASFHGQTGMNLEASFYGQTAVQLDYSGCLAAIGKRQVARAVWLGKPPSDQIPYTDRD